MPLFGDLFFSEILHMPVYDPKGDVIGKVWDALVVKGDPFPALSALLVGKKNRLKILQWNEINIFNKRIISSFTPADAVKPYVPGPEDLLAARDILDKQIVDIDGVKVVRVNDIRMEGHEDKAVLSAIDVGARGLMRRMGVERRSDQVLRIFKASMGQTLIPWNVVQPLNHPLTTIGLTVSRQKVADLHPADIADIISQISREEGAHLFKELDIETAAEAFSELEPDVQSDILSGLDVEKAADLLEEMPPDEAADVLGDLPDDKAKELLEKIEKNEAEDIQELLGHEEDTAGGIMTTEYLAYPPELTVAEAIERFKKDAPEVEGVYYLYIVDPHEKLTGVVSLKELILADPAARLGDIMETQLKSVSPEEDEREVAGIISKYNVVALPVVDETGVLLGIVTVDDIVDRILPPAAKKKRR